MPLFLVRYLALSVVLFVLWLLLSGYPDKATLVGFGVASVAVTVWVSARAGVLDNEGVPTRVFPGILRYMVWLTVEIGKANLLVAREAIRPQLRLSPKMIRVPAYQASDLGKTIFANSVTLTPGTVSVDVDVDSLVIHALSEEFADEAAIAHMGERVCAFDGPEGRAWAAERRRAQRETGGGEG